MEFLLFHQDPHFPQSPIPEGFAIVPLQLFLVMAHQVPLPNTSAAFASAVKPISQGTLYDRAMTCSAN